MNAATPGEMTREVHALLRRSCAECHDPEASRRIKGDFDQVLNLQLMLEDEFYIVPGYPEDSELYLLMIDPDPDLVMPPPDSDVHQPTEAEIALVHDWISMITPEMDLHVLLTPPPEPPPALEPTRVSKKASPLRTIFARMHPLLVHFPIALLILAAVVEWLGWILKKTMDWEPVVAWTLTVSALSSPVAVAMGWILAEIEGYRDATITNHRTFGLITAILSLTCMLLWIRKQKNSSRRVVWLFRFLLLAAAILVGLAGHTGGELVYGEGYPFY